MNSSPEIPDKFKPFHPPTVGHRLDNPIYVGTLLWDQNSTGIVADTRVLEPNAEGDIIRVPNFCKGIVDQEMWDKQTVRNVRRERLQAARAVKQEAETGKLLNATAPGVAYQVPSYGSCSLPVWPLDNPQLMHSICDEGRAGEKVHGLHLPGARCRHLSKQPPGSRGMAPHRRDLRLEGAAFPLVRGR